jgi:cytochrome c oxidase assembly protein subunit 15
MQATIATPPPITKQPANALRRFAWALLAYNVLVILWGAVVRATSSGAGCGDHWPLCNGTIVQHHPRAATIIEFLHRMSSGLVLIGILFLVVWTFRSTVRGAWARVTASVATALTVNEAFLGAMLVKLGYVDKNASIGRSIFFSLHLSNTLLMLAVLAITASFLSARTLTSRYDTRLRHLPTAFIGLGATLIVGVTGSLAALGDTLFPAQTLSAALIQDLAPHTNWLIRVRILHPLSAMVATFFIGWLVFRAATTTEGKPQRSLALGVIFLLGIQIVLGLADVTLLAPLWLQVMHLLGADLLWIAMVVLTVSLCISPRGIRSLSEAAG